VDECKPLLLHIILLLILLIRVCMSIPLEAT
jgi:hypothetical protein